MTGGQISAVVKCTVGRGMRFLRLVILFESVRASERARVRD